MVNVKNLVIGIVIAFVFLFFCVYGMKLAYAEPKYEEFCNETFYPSYPEKLILEQNCTFSEALNQKGVECQNSYDRKGEALPVYDNRGCQIDIKCSDCRYRYDLADEVYSKNLFIIGVIVGVIVIAIAALLIPIESVSGGLMFGSLMFIIYGTGRYWRFMNDWLRFIILGIALAIFIYLGYRVGSNVSKKATKRKRK